MTNLKRMTTIRLSGKKYIEKAMFAKKLMNYEDLIKVYENEFVFKEPVIENDGLNEDMTSEEALTRLKKAKEKLDLQLITQEEYDKIKKELAKYIK